MTTMGIGFVLHMAGFYSAGRAADMLAQARNTGRLAYSGDPERLIRSIVNT